MSLGQLARCAHVNKEYFILEKDGIPVIGILDADELENYLDLRDSSVPAAIRRSNADVKAGRVHPAGALLKSVKSTGRTRKPRR